MTIVDKTLIGKQVAHLDLRDSAFYSDNLSVKEFATNVAMAMGTYTLCTHEIDRLRIIRQLHPFSYMRMREVSDKKMAIREEFVERTGKKPALFPRGLASMMISRTASLGIFAFMYLLHRRDVEAHDVKHKKMKLAGLFALQQYVASVGEANKIRQIYFGMSGRELYKKCEGSWRMITFWSGYPLHLLKTGIIGTTFYATSGVVSEIYKKFRGIPYYEPGYVGSFVGGSISGAIAAVMTNYVDIARQHHVIHGNALTHLKITVPRGPTWINTMATGLFYRIPYIPIGGVAAFLLEQFLYERTGSSSFFWA